LGWDRLPSVDPVGGWERATNFLIIYHHHNIIIILTPTKIIIKTTSNGRGRQCRHSPFDTGYYYNINIHFKNTKP
jgi:hypothetical protein